MPDAPKTIYKYPLLLTADPQTITVPLGAEFIHAATQHDTPTVWAVVPAVRGLNEDRVFHVVGTGGAVPPNADHVGTVHIEGYVFHLFLTRRGAFGSDQS